MLTPAIRTVIRSQPDQQQAVRQIKQWLFGQSQQQPRIHRINPPRQQARQRRWGRRCHRQQSRLRWLIEQRSHPSWARETLIHGFHGGIKHRFKILILYWTPVPTVMYRWLSMNKQTPMARQRCIYIMTVVLVWLPTQPPRRLRLPLAASLFIRSTLLGLPTLEGTPLFEFLAPAH